MLSLASNKNCMLMDDELNILPCSTLVKYIVPIEVDEDGHPVGGTDKEVEKELSDLKESLEDAQVSNIMNRCYCILQIMHSTVKVVSVVDAGCCYMFRGSEFIALAFPRTLLIS